MKRSARLDEAQATDLGLFCACLLRPFFVDFCEKCDWPFAGKFDQFLFDGRGLQDSNAVFEKELLEIIPDTDEFEDVSVSYATYAGFALHTALFQPSGADSVKFIWAVVDLIEYNAESKVAGSVFAVVDTALRKLESGDGLGDLNVEDFSWCL